MRTLHPVHNNPFLLGFVCQSFAECWSLDPTGNWKKFLEDDNGDGTWDLDQARTANDVNEITDITETVGPSWVTPEYSKEGNMTTMPQPVDPTSSYTATYDAWNRLVKLVDGANTVAEYEYDGSKRRTIKKSYTGGTLNETGHLYYTEPSKWQVIEERIDTSSNAKQQHVWGRRYIDDIVLRDRDTTGNGTLDERLYGLQDANWNITTLCDATGIVQERFAYSSYGTPLFLNASFVSQSSSTSEWSTLFCGYRFDFTVELYHVRNRVYHASLGVWVQRDPLGLSVGVNLFEYANSKPIISVDPMGLFALPVPVVVVYFIIAIIVVLYLSVMARVMTENGPATMEISLPINFPSPSFPQPRNPEPEMSNRLRDFLITIGIIRGIGKGGKEECEEKEDCDCWCITFQGDQTTKPVWTGLITKTECLAMSQLFENPGEPVLEVECACGEGWWELE